jgi:hypothetical protein
MITPPTIDEVATHPFFLQKNGGCAATSSNSKGGGGCLVTPRIDGWLHGHPSTSKGFFFSFKLWLMCLYF